MSLNGRFVGLAMVFRVGVETSGKQDRLSGKGRKGKAPAGQESRKRGRQERREGELERGDFSVFCEVDHKTETRSGLIFFSGDKEIS